MKQDTPSFLNSAVAIETVRAKPHASVETAARPIKDARGQRDLGLDFVKGVLVIVMVAYHVLDYFVVGADLLYRYLHFVSGAFIFTTGYVVAGFYKDKYVKDKARTSKRLISRGF